MAVHHRAARRIDEQGTGLHHGKGLGADEAAGIVRQGAVQGNDIGTAEQLFPAHEFERLVAGLVHGAAGAGDDVHLEGVAYFRHTLAEVAEAENAEGLAGELHLWLEPVAEIAAAVPFAVHHAGMVQAGAAAELKDEREHVLGHGAHLSQ